MQSDYTIPVYRYSKIFNAIIDWDYWRNKDPVFPEDALIWFTDGSRADSGTGSGILGIRPNRCFTLWVNLPRFFKPKYMPFFYVRVKIKEGLINISKSLFFLIARLHLRHLAARK
jgi:hypothetical protein